MFGIIYTGIVLACKALVGIQNEVTDIGAIDKAKNEKSLTYRDHRGCERLTSTGEPIYCTTLANGDRVIKGNGGRIIRNISEEARWEWIEKENKELAKKTDQVVIVGYFQDLYPERVRKVGTIWQNLTGKEKVYKYLKDGRYYFRMCTGYSRNRYVDVETGREYFLYQDYSDDEIIWLHNHNVHWDNMENPHLDWKELS